MFNTEQEKLIYLRDKSKTRQAGASGCRGCRFNNPDHCDLIANRIEVKCNTNRDIIYLNELKQEMKQITITIPIPSLKATKKQIKARARNNELRILRGILANARYYRLTDSVSELTERINSMVVSQYQELAYPASKGLYAKAVKLGRLYWYLDRGVLTSSKEDPFLLS